MDCSWDDWTSGAKERRLVCVTSANSLLAKHVVKQLLARGYSVRVTLQTQEEIEEVREEEEDMRRVESVVMANMGDVSSLYEAFRGCVAVFHTSAFIDPKGVSGYSERMALLEAKGAENVVEACGRAACVRRCIFTSSLLACIWQRNGVSRVLDESCWTDEDFCRENKFWLALGKTMAEKAAWRVSEEMGVKLLTVCHGLLTGPSVPSAYDAPALAYLKGGQAMMQRGALATADVRKVAEAHVCIYEAMDQGSCGRYLCFDKAVTSGDEAMEFEQRLKMPGLLSRGRNVSQGEQVAAEAHCILSNTKLANLLSRASRHHCCNQ